MSLRERNIEKEIDFKTSRSGGKGGQNVNKVETKAETVFNVMDSEILTDEEKTLIYVKLKNKIDGEGNIRVVSQEHRSQLKNKNEAAEKLITLLEKALIKKKKRKPTKPTTQAKEKRLKEKKVKGKKKKMRGLPPDIN